MIATVLVWVGWAVIGYLVVGAVVTAYWWQEELDKSDVVEFLTQQSLPESIHIAAAYTNDHMWCWPALLVRRLR